MVLRSGSSPLGISLRPGSPHGRYNSVPQGSDHGHHPDRRVPHRAASRPRIEARVRPAGRLHPAAVRHARHQRPADDRQLRRAGSGFRGRRVRPPQRAGLRRRHLRRGRSSAARGSRSAAAPPGRGEARTSEDRPRRRRSSQRNVRPQPALRTRRCPNPASRPRTRRRRVPPSPGRPAAIRRSCLWVTRAGPSATSSHRANRTKPAPVVSGSTSIGGSPPRFDANRGKGP